MWQEQGGKMGEAVLEVLRMIEEGTISAEEGERLLAAMKGGEPDDQTEDDQPEEETSSPPPTGEPSPDQESEPVPAGGPAGWQHIWIYPLIGGIVVLALAGFWTDRLVDGGVKQGWLACSIPLMVFGGLLALLAWWSSQARWLHVRVRDEEKHIKISMPLPLRPAAWLVRLARPWVPQFQDTAIDELILSLDEIDNEEGLLVVQVDEGDGEQVQVYFG
jgi:hypothetical protein